VQTAEATAHGSVRLRNLVLLKVTVTAGLHDMTKRKDQDETPDAAHTTAVDPAAPKARQTDMNSQDHDVEVPALDSRIQGLIGRELRAHYDALVKDQIPESLLKLLDDLAKSERDHKKDNSVWWKEHQAIFTRPLWPRCPISGRSRSRCVVTSRWRTISFKRP